MLSQEVPKSSVQLFCDKCQYVTCRKSQFDRHVLTAKHKILTNNYSLEVTSSRQEYICECNKSYKHRQSLFTHKKKCNFHELPITDNSNNQLILKELLREVVKQHKEHMTEFTNTIKELIPKVGNLVSNSK